jgi:hypothetical protein
VSRYAAALAPGSCVVVTTFAAAPGPDADRLIKIYSAGPHPVCLHSGQEIASFFGDLDLLPPGVTDARTWRPAWETVPAPEPRGTWVHGGLARKTR